MTLDQLEMIRAIVETGSYQAAAKKLNKSQPSLSVGVKKIEEFYGIRLFSREGYRPTLTVQGQRFYQQARHTLNSFKELDKIAKELAGEKEPYLHFSIDPIVGAKHLDRVFGFAQEESLHTCIRIESGVLFENAEKLLKGQVDLAIGFLPQLGDPNLEVVPMCDVQLVPVLSKKRLGQHKLTSEFLDQVPSIVVRSMGQDGAASLPEHQKNWFVTEHARKKDLILQGYGWGRLGLSEIDDRQDLMIIPKEMLEPIDLKIYFMRHRQKAYGEVAKRIWNQLNSI
jgi:DNA-binding transcriptional LysR family regulator